MSKIIVYGTGPLMEPGVEMFSSHGLRSWHITKPLLDAGHDVRLYTQPIFDPNNPRQHTAGLEEREYQGFCYFAFRNCYDQHNIRLLEQACREFAPDALVGVNAYPSSILARVNCRAPMWADTNGSVTIEGQIKARADGSDELLGHYWTMEQAILRRADRLSTVSERQLYLMYGQLSALGRMNRHTFAHPFAETIPNAFYPVFTDPEAAARGTLRLRGERLSDDAFILLWSGCYTVWCDFPLLQRGLELAMAQCPNLYYVSTGGPVYGHDDNSYPRFKGSVESGPFADRFHFLGWIDGVELPGVMAQADLGLQVDSWNFETVFGARNRTINMLAAGLPVLTTRGAEINEELIAAGGAIGCPNDDPEALARTIIELYNDRPRLQEIARRGCEYVREHFSYERTTRGLVAWAASPEFAPDNLVKLEQAPQEGNPFLMALNPIEESLAGNGAVALAGAKKPAARAPGLTPLEAEDRFRSPLQRAVLRTLGTDRYNKLRFLRRVWSKDVLPRFWRRQVLGDKTIAHGLEELVVFLTNQCNARCTHCFYIDELGYVPGEMRLEDYQKLAPSLPKLRQVTITGGDAILHPQCKEIVELIATATRCDRIMMMTNGFLPARVEKMVSEILANKKFPGVLDILISIDGLEETHNEMRGNKKAWELSNKTLAFMSRLKELYPGKVDTAVNTTITDRNYKDIRPLYEYIRSTYPNVRQGFELVRGTSFSVWDLPDDVRTDYNPPGATLPPDEALDEIVDLLREFNRKAGFPHHSYFLTTPFTVQMHREKKKLFDCIAAGNTNGLIFPTGEVALCEFSQPFGKLQDYDMDFGKAWTSTEADSRRAQLKQCYCTHGSYLSKNIEYSLRGQMAILTKV